MTIPIRPTDPTNVLPTAAGSSREGDLHHVAAEFESMMLRQLLTASKVGGNTSGYSDMAVDAMASGITQAGGVGLARQIETALAGQTERNRMAPALSHSSPEDDGRSQS